MYKHYSSRLLAAAMIAGLGMSGGAMAAEGDWMVRVGPAHVSPNDDSGEHTAVGGAELAVDATTSLGLTVTYMASDHIGVGLLAAWPFEHDIKGAGATLDGTGKLAEVKHLPPTLTLQYHFTPASNLRPWLGAGLNYTTFFSEKTRGPLDGDLSLDDSVGLAVEAGVEFDINENWFVSGQLWYIAIETTAELRNATLDGVGALPDGDIDVDIDPWVAMVGAGMRF